MYRTPELKIEIKPGMSVSDIHDVLAAALELPDYYGKNWDAFQECYNDDLASNPPATLIVLGWNIFVSEHPNEARVFWDCISEEKTTNKPTIFFFSPRACPCCNYLTLQDWNLGSWELCSVCNWEDDALQYKNPDYVGGANGESLNQARDRFKKIVAHTDYVQEFRIESI